MLRSPAVQGSVALLSGWEVSRPIPRSMTLETLRPPRVCDWTKPYEHRTQGIMSAGLRRTRQCHQNDNISAIK